MAHFKFMNIKFYIRYSTSFGQTLWINTIDEFVSSPIDQAIPMNYINEELWSAEIKVPKDQINIFKYKYFLKDENGEILPEHGNDRYLRFSKNGIKEIQVIDTWNHAGEYENVFYSAPFKNTLLKQPDSDLKPLPEKKITHAFKVKAPLLKKNESVCLIGNCKALGSWSTESPILLIKEGNWWVARMDLSDQSFPIAYKYGVCKKKDKSFIGFESGKNRILHQQIGEKKISILHDGFINLPNSIWKGSGVAIPVFSLRSKKSFGIGEFSDLKLLADWAKKTGLKLIQILPINDTTATHGWSDSYPYAAISAFALHPIYINLEKLIEKKNDPRIKSIRKKQKLLNALPDLEYVEVMKTKLEFLQEIYNETTDDFFRKKEFEDFFKPNKHWLIPYAAFCYLRDNYGTSDYGKWKTYSVYIQKEIENLSSKKSGAYNEIAFYYFVQYHLHVQLKEAADYVHKKGVVLKGDIAIGVNRNGCDTWVEPELYQMQWQAGAPPDDFADKGQNWGFPTYNWKKMQEDQFDWWRKRFEQMSNYFDAFRIDHILGFFRIWSIPDHAVEGIMGHFIPSIPVSITEFGEKGILFDKDRYCKPYINDELLTEIFGEESEKIKSKFLVATDLGFYELKPTFNTQKKIEAHFKEKSADVVQEKIKIGLYDLVSNVILFEEHGVKGQKFHFRISMEKTFSYRNLDSEQQKKLYELYINYFYRRQDEFWLKEAMHKLPYLKSATNMLICGEDLGMVPHCVPDVMQQLGILSLEIQRMPKKDGTEFFHPNDAPYLSVITPSTHDMNTIRGWWEEDKTKISKFYNSIMGQQGEPPFYCEPWINRAIVLQHFYSPAMWCIFQLQDLLGIDESLRLENPHNERINVPADPNNKWKYRMHLTIEELIKQKDFNEELKGYVEHSGR